MRDSNGNTASSSLKSDLQTPRPSCGSSTPTCATRAKLDELHTTNLSSPSGNLKSGQSQAPRRRDRSRCLSERLLQRPREVVSRVVPRLLSRGGVQIWGEDGKNPRELSPCAGSTGLPAHLPTAPLEPTGAGEGSRGQGHLAGVRASIKSTPETRFPMPRAEVGSEHQTVFLPAPSWYGCETQTLSGSKTPKLRADQHTYGWRSGGMSHHKCEICVPPSLAVLCTLVGM